MAELQDISILIIDDSFEEISRISSVLDNSGFRVRSHKAETEEELADQLNSENLDIILIKQNSESLSPKVLFQTLNRLEKDVPSLVMVPTLSGKETAQFLRMGAKDVIADDEDQHMAAVISRELKSKALREDYRNVSRKLSSSEHRYQELLEHSKLPIGIVQESMFVLINESFCDIFELDQDDTDALPVVDLLDKDARQTFKDLYKEYVSAPDAFGNEEFTTDFTDSLGTVKNIKIEVNTIKYNDEDSLQLKIDSPKTEVSAEVFTDPSGAVPRQRMIQLIDNCIGLTSSKNSDETKDSCLACIQIDAYDDIQEAEGIGSADELYGVFQLFVSEYFTEKPICAFDSNHLLVLFEAQGQEPTLQQCQDFCKALDKQVFEFGINSRQLTCTVGIGVISELITSADTVIKRSLRACVQLLESIEGDIGNGAALYEPEASEVDQEAIDINYLIKQAFKYSHLELLYQPMLNFHGDSGKHYEVLLGLKKENSDIYPENFITMATRTNENPEIDKWVILESMRALIQKEVCDGDESLYLHLSKLSIRDPAFVSWLTAAISKSKIKPDRLAFQLREPDISSNLKTSTDLVNDISKLGCKVIITNFGSSVQPLKILESISFDFAKVDMSFALDAQSSSEGAEKLTELLKQISSTGIPAIVPCIESAAVLPILWQSNVAYIQGYYVQKPSTVMDYTP